jgi:hypothetical protein
MFERFTKDARRVVLTAAMTAGDSGAAKAGPGDLLLAVAVEGGVGARVLESYGITAAGLRAAGESQSGRAGFTDEEISALRSVGIDAEEVFRRIEEAFGPGALDEPVPPSPRPRRRGLVGGPFDKDARKVIELSLREAIALRHRYIGSEHILLALLRQGPPAPMSTVLTRHGVTYTDARERVLTELNRAA